MYSQYANANRGNMNDQERHKRIADLQREMMMVEADMKKFLNEKAMLEAEERKIKKDIDSLRTNMQEKERKIRVSNQNIDIKRAEIMHLRKLLNVL
jgi:predicted  nucleic acid-binding Zn-ribbon protein